MDWIGQFTSKQLQSPCWHWSSGTNIVLGHIQWWTPWPWHSPLVVECRKYYKPSQNPSKLMTPQLHWNLLDKDKIVNHHQKFGYSLRQYFFASLPFPTYQTAHSKQCGHTKLLCKTMVLYLVFLYHIPSRSVGHSVLFHCWLLFWTDTRRPEKLQWLDRSFGVHWRCQAPEEDQEAHEDYHAS